MCEALCARYVPGVRNVLYALNALVLVVVCVVVMNVYSRQQKHWHEYSEKYPCRYFSACRYFFHFLMLYQNSVRQSYCFFVKIMPSGRFISLFSSVNIAVVRIAL